MRATETCEAVSRRPVSLEEELDLSQPRLELFQDQDTSHPHPTAARFRHQRVQRNRSFCESLQVRVSVEMKCVQWHHLRLHRKILQESRGQRRQRLQVLLLQFFVDAVKLSHRQPEDGT